MSKLLFREKSGHHPLCETGAEGPHHHAKYDCYGAGGIFRPVTLGTLVFNPELDLSK